jgi:hypothetical protein
MDRIWAGPAAATAIVLPTNLRDRLTSAVSGHAGRQQAEFCRIEVGCDGLAVASAAFLGDLKRLLLDGLLLLERSDGAMAIAASGIDPAMGVELTAIAHQIPGLLTRWLEQVAIISEI